MPKNWNWKDWTYYFLTGWWCIPSFKERDAIDNQRKES
jgi:hypothetical protein